MSRFFKSAAFPILIVVVLAFFASKLVDSNSGAKIPNFGETLSAIKSNNVNYVTLDQKDNSMNVVLRDGQKYSVSYTNGYVSQIISDDTKTEGSSALQVSETVCNSAYS